MYYGVVFHSYEELKIAIDEYIKYYNEKRTKEKLDWLSPVAYIATSLITRLVASCSSKRKKIRAETLNFYSDKKSNFLGSP